MRFSGIFQTISFTVRKRFVNAFLPSPYTVSKPSKNAPKTAKKIRNACGKNPHPLPPSCGSQSPKNRFVRPFFGILQVLAPKTPARWPFSHSLCVFTPHQKAGHAFKSAPCSNTPFRQAFYCRFSRAANTRNTPLGNASTKTMPRAMAPAIFNVSTPLNRAPALSPVIKAYTV